MAMSTAAIVAQPTTPLMRVTGGARDPVPLIVAQRVPADRGAVNRGRVTAGAPFGHGHGHGHGGDGHGPRSTPTDGADDRRRRSAVGRGRAAAGARFGHGHGHGDGHGPRSTPTDG